MQQKPEVNFTGSSQRIFQIEEYEPSVRAAFGILKSESGRAQSAALPFDRRVEIDLGPQGISRASSMSLRAAGT
jgi:hypothetical protein